MPVEIPLIMIDRESSVVPENPAFLAQIRERAIAWAKRCGLKPPFTVTGPERVEYPQEGYGYTVLVQETTGKERLGTARFSSTGRETYWTVDGVVGMS